MYAASRLVTWRQCARTYTQTVTPRNASLWPAMGLERAIRARSERVVAYLSVAERRRARSAQRSRAVDSPRTLATD
jgi:hypothetical protein